MIPAGLGAGLGSGFSDLVDFGEVNTFDKELSESFAGKEYDSELSETFSPVRSAESRSLNTVEKEMLSDIHMTPANIEKCTVDADGVFNLNCINREYAGMSHPESGISYNEKIVDIDGVRIRGVFPEFSSIYETRLPPDLRAAPESEQFNYLNKELSQQVKGSPDLRGKFNDRQLEMIGAGYKPVGCTWHHNEELCKMQLVKFEDHNATRHTGGNSIWSDGT